jgi:hypothetical protein
MLAMAARHADGIMLSDFVPERVKWSREIIDPLLQERGVVLAHSGSFVKAFHRKTPEIERFREFERAGLNEIALCLYDDPEASIRVIGERVVPALG